MNQPRTLVQMHNRPTSYEIVAKSANKEVRLGFLVGVNKSNILDLARSNGAVILAMIDELSPGWNDRATYTAAGWQFGPVRIGKSGRTERELAQ